MSNKYYTKNEQKNMECAFKNCNNIFEQRRSDMIYCSKLCRMRVANEVSKNERKSIGSIPTKEISEINKMFLVRGEISARHW